MGRGAPVQFSHDLLRGRAYLVKGWETRLQLSFETGQVSAQSRATGIHEMLEKRAGHRPQHWFAADILLDAFAEFHERAFDPHGLWRSKQAQQMLDIRFAFLELTGLGEKGFQVLFCPREILLQAQQNGCGPNAGMRHDRQRIRRVSIPHRERAENVVIRFETSFTAVLDRDVHPGKPATDHVLDILEGYLVQVFNQAIVGASVELLLAVTRGEMLVQLLVVGMQLRIGMEHFGHVTPGARVKRFEQVITVIVGIGLFQLRLIGK